MVAKRAGVTNDIVRPRRRPVLVVAAIAVTQIVTPAYEFLSLIYGHVLLLPTPSVLGLHTLTAPVPIAIHTHDGAHGPLPATFPAAVGAIAPPTGTRMVLNRFSLVSIREGGVYPSSVLLTHQLSADVAVVYCWDDLISSH